MDLGPALTRISSQPAVLNKSLKSACSRPLKFIAAKTKINIWGRELNKVIRHNRGRNELINIEMLKIKSYSFVQILDAQVARNPL